MIQKRPQHLLAALTPSALGASVTVAASGLLVAGVYIKSFGSQGAVQQGLFSASSITGPTYRQITDRLSENSLVSNATLFLFWAAIGLIVYLLASSIIRAFSDEVELEKELHYVNAPRVQIIRYEIIKALVRALVLAVWLVFMQLFLKIVLPYVLAIAYAARLESPLQQIVQLLLGVLIMFLSLHLHIVFLRLLLLKTRVFADPDES